MLEAATPRLGGNCTQELAQLKKAFNMSLKSGDTFLMSTDGERARVQPRPTFARISVYPGYAAGHQGARVAGSMFDVTEA